MMIMIMIMTALVLFRGLHLDVIEWNEDSAFCGHAFSEIISLHSRQTTDKWTTVNQINAIPIPTQSGSIRSTITDTQNGFIAQNTGFGRRAGYSSEMYSAA